MGKEDQGGGGGGGGAKMRRIKHEGEEDGRRMKERR